MEGYGGIHATRDHNNVTSLSQNTNMSRAIQNTKCGKLTSGVVIRRDNARLPPVYLLEECWDLSASTISGVDGRYQNVSELTGGRFLCHNLEEKVFPDTTNARNPVVTMLRLMVKHVRIFIYNNFFTDRLCGLMTRVLTTYPEVRVLFPALPEFLKSSLLCVCWSTCLFASCGHTFSK
jgi:hypothetical protein